MSDPFAEANARLNAHLAPFIQRMMNEGNRQEEERAKADPLGHKLTRVMANTNYRYVPAGRDGRGRQVWFCWSTHRNVAGFYLGWREVRTKTGGKRDQWLSRRTRKRCMEVAERRAAAYQRKRAESPINPPLPPQD